MPTTLRRKHLSWRGGGISLFWRVCFGCAAILFAVQSFHIPAGSGRDWYRLGVVFSDWRHAPPTDYVTNPIAGSRYRPSVELAGQAIDHPVTVACDVYAIARYPSLPMKPHRARLAAGGIVVLKLYPGEALTH